jgi:hypothetical protein
MFFNIIERAMFIIDDKGILRQITINDRPVGRNVSEAHRLIKEIQHADKLHEISPKSSFPEGKKKQNYLWSTICLFLIVISSNIHKSRSLLFSEKSLLCELIE